MTSETLMFASLVAVLGILYYLTPSFGSAGIFFGITVDPSFRDSEVGRLISRQFRITTLIITALSCLLCFAVPSGDIAAIALLLIPLQAVGVTVALVIGRRAVKPHAIRPSQVREAILAHRPNRMPGGALGALGPFALLAATAVVVYSNWESLPARLPVHWGLNLQPNRWVDRTPRSVNGALIGAALVSALMLMLAYSILLSRRVNVSGFAADRESRHRAMNVWILLGAAYLVAIMACVPLLMTIAAGPETLTLMGLVIGIIAALSLVALVFALVRFARRNSELPANAPTRVQGDSTPDDRWYGGMLYFNREDPALFVEKRFGFGYTLNMGHPVSWAITLLFIVLPFLLAALR